MGKNPCDAGKTGMTDPVVGGLFGAALSILRKKVKLLGFPVLGSFSRKGYLLRMKKPVSTRIIPRFCHP
jgi:hypothetical protein